MVNSDVPEIYLLKESGGDMEDCVIYCLHLVVYHRTCVFGDNVVVVVEEEDLAVKAIYV
jgi:hypothetical protein